MDFDIPAAWLTGGGLGTMVAALTYTDDTTQNAGECKPAPLIELP